MYEYICRQYVCMYDIMYLVQGVREVPTTGQSAPSYKRLDHSTRNAHQM
jgi:hypothetical protein